MQDFSVKAYREDLKKHGVFHTDPKLAQILKKYCPNTPRSVYEITLQEMIPSLLAVA